MTKKEAIEFYFKKYPRAAESVKRLQGWDKEISVSKNADKLGMRRTTAGMFRKTFNLECAKELTKKQLQEKVRLLEKQLTKNK